jgi:hypothetical protein
LSPVLIHVKEREKKTKVTQLSNFRKFDFAQDVLPPEFIIIHEKGRKNK